MLKIDNTRLFLCLPFPGLDAAQWKASWDENSEICYHMLEVIKQWGAQVFLAMNPTVCLTALPMLMFPHLHSQSSGISNPTLFTELNRRKDSWDGTGAGENGACNLSYRDVEDSKTVT